MPSFFQGLGRIMQGKPVYDPNDPQPPTTNAQYPNAPNSGDLANPLDPSVDTNGQPATETTTAEEPQIQKNIASTFPVMTVKRTMTRMNGENMQVYAYIVNNAQMPLDLHKIKIFGREEEIRRPMRPGEDREFLIYEGPQVAGTGDHEMLLIYKTESGDYFEAIHDIRFTFNQATRLYSIDEMRLRLPIRDIYG